MAGPIGRGVTGRGGSGGCTTGSGRGRWYKLVLCGWDHCTILVAVSFFEFMQQWLPGFASANPGSHCC